MPSLPDALFDAAVDLLLSSMDTEKDRQAMLANSNLYSVIEWAGSSRVFTRKLVRLLSHDGLIQLLQKVVVGEEKRSAINSLCVSIAQQRAPATSHVLSSGTVGALEQTTLSKSAQTSSAARAHSVRTCHQELIGTLCRVRRKDGLFGSRQSDDRFSSTVSAIAALALFESEDTHSGAQDTIASLISERATTGVNKDAWPPQAGSVFHTIATAWPIFAIARILPDRLMEIQHSIAWLVNRARSKGAGWGFHTRSAVDAYPTAFAINALLAVRSCEQASRFRRSLQESIDSAIRDGARQLLQAAIRRPEKRELYWSGDSDDEGQLCLATTSLCYHVLKKYLLNNSGGAIDTVEVESAINAMLVAISQGLAASGVKGVEFEIPLSERILRAPTWPVRHVTDGINYTYAFFTPLIAVTIVDLCKAMADNSDRQALRKVCWILVDWIVKQAGESASRGGLLSVPGQGPAIWATAQGALVLGRISRAAEWL